MNIVLASASPRRRALLEMLDVKNLLIVPARGEEQPPPGLDAEGTVLCLSRAKAAEVAALRGAEDLIIAADTVVELDGKILGKPRDEREAADMLRALSGREHRVFTGVTVMVRGQTLSRAERTAVRFRQLEDGEIGRYVASGEPMDKAGAYGIQGRAGAFIAGIEGDYFNVVGLPLCMLSELLKKLGVELL